MSFKEGNKIYPCSLAEQTNSISSGETPLYSNPPSISLYVAKHSFPIDKANQNSFIKSNCSFKNKFDLFVIISYI